MLPLHDTVSLTISWLQIEQALQLRTELEEDRRDRLRANLLKSDSELEWLTKRLDDAKEKNAFLRGQTATAEKTGRALDKVR